MYNCSNKCNILDVSNYNSKVYFIYYDINCIKYLIRYIYILLCNIQYYYILYIYSIEYTTYSIYKSII